MTTRNRPLTSWLLVALAATTTEAQPPPPATDAEAMFRTLDADRDGVLTVGEGGPGTQQTIRRLFEMTGTPATRGIGLDEFRMIHDRQRRRSPPPAPEPRPIRSETPARQPGAARDPRAASPAGPAAPRLQGTWRGWVVDGRGENPDTGHLQMELRIEGNRMVARELETKRAPEGLGEGTFVVDATGDSGTLDAVATGGRHAGKEYPGIFSLEGDTLRWCVNNHNRRTRRPEEFETGRGFYFMVLRRQAAD